MPVPLIASFLLTQQVTQQRVSSLTGSIERITNFESKLLGNKRNLSVYLPPNYDQETSKKYPVLYMQDGQNVFDGATSYIPNQEWRADEAAEALISAGLIEPLIIVAIDNAGAARGDEYLPCKIKMGGSEMGGKAELYSRMMSEELMPLVNSKYRTKTGSTNTGVIGSSFGGVISCYLGAKMPNVFGKVGIVSPSVWVNDRELLRMITPLSSKQSRPKIWLDMGSKEGTTSVKDVNDLYSAYVKAGWRPKRDIVCVIDGNAEHNELAWSRRIMSILVYLFGK